MARPSTTTLVFGDLRVAVFDFAKAGDVFPVHVHSDPATNHISIVARSGIQCQGAVGIAGRELGGGDVVDWPLGQAHGFTATEDDTRLVNICRVLGPK